MKRIDRENLELRKIKVIPDYITNCPGSILYEQGNTKIIATATFDSKIPNFLINQQKGWITAEYSMIPGAVGRDRFQRERNRVNSRSIEIQRFIGRALRNTISLRQIEKLTIFIDTDVLQADGSTRCAAINSSMLALVKLLKYLVFEAIIPEIPEIEFVAAVSLGIKNDDIFVDLNYEEDSQIEADINIVSSENGSIFEISGFAEESSISKNNLIKVIDIGLNKNKQIIEILKTYTGD